MARARNIKPGFFVNDSLLEMGFATRLLFVGLWTLADREGRLEDRPKKIKIGVFPVDNVEITVMLDELHAAGFVKRYVVNGEKYLQIVNWHKHQAPHHTEKASVIPSEEGEITVKTPLKPGCPRKGNGGNPPDSLIPDSLIPEKEAKASTSKARLPTCPREEIVGIYHDVLPELPGVRVMDSKREKAISEFWRWVLTSNKTDGSKRAEDAAGALEWIRAYFERARANDFIMGRGSRTEEHKNWRCSIEYLLSTRGLKKVIEETTT